MVKTILNISGDRTGKSSLKITNRSIAHSFRSSEDRQKGNDGSPLEKTGETNYVYFYDEKDKRFKVSDNTTDHTPEVQEKLRSDIEPMESHWKETFTYKDKHIDFDNYINGNNQKHIFDETIIGYSKELYDNQPITNPKKYLQDEVENYAKVFKQTTGKELHIAGATLHLDETTPHIHIFSSNVYETSKGNPTITNPLKNRLMYSKLQDNFQESAKQRYGEVIVDRTDRQGKSKINRLSLQEGQALIAKQNQKIDDLVKRVEKLNEQIEHKQSYINELNDNINEKTEKVDELKDLLDAYENKATTKLLKHLPLLHKIADKKIQKQTELIEKYEKEFRDTSDRLTDVQIELDEKQDQLDDVSHELNFNKWASQQKYSDGSTYLDNINDMKDEYDEYLKQQQGNKQDSEPQEA